MTSGGLGLTEGLGQDISQEELDFSELFLYNQPEFSPPLLVVNHQTAYISASNQPTSNQDTSSHSPNTENLTRVVFDTLGLTSRTGIPAPSPRIEITPSGDSLSSQTLEPSPGSKARGAYRECVSPASSNSSTGWAAEGYSPLPSPCVSPSNVGSCGMGLSPSDLCSGLQGIHTSSSAHSSPGASPRNSITDETFLQPQDHTTSPLPHRRSRSVSPQRGKRFYDQTHPSQEGIPVKQRSRSPSPIPSIHEQQGSYYLHQYQAQPEFHPQLQTSASGLEEILNSLGSGRAKIQDCVYGEGYDWPVEQEKMSRSGAEIKPETFYMLPTVCGLPLAPLPSLEWSLPSQSGQYELLIQQQPRSHHRAHYETEGSRGAVKTPNGGHPEVQVRGFICRYKKGRKKRAWQFNPREECSQVTSAKRESGGFGGKTR
uniref:RHD domain-containing protein n=1 Tax=Amphilophus citrinellus TaxID=61819 RepID=A0A3Q0S484_AMPCI